MVSSERELKIVADSVPVFGLNSNFVDATFIVDAVPVFAEENNTYLLVFAVSSVNVAPPPPPAIAPHAVAFYPSKFPVSLL